MDHELLDASNRRGHAGKAERHRFHEDVGHPLVEGGQDERVGRLQHAGQVRAVPEQMHSGGHAARGGQRSRAPGTVPRPATTSSTGRARRDGVASASMTWSKPFSGDSRPAQHTTKAPSGRRESARGTRAISGTRTPLGMTTNFSRGIPQRWW